MVSSPVPQVGEFKVVESASQSTVQLTFWKIVFAVMFGNIFAAAVIGFVYGIATAH